MDLTRLRLTNEDTGNLTKIIKKKTAIEVLGGNSKIILKEKH